MTEKTTTTKKTTTAKKPPVKETAKKRLSSKDLRKKIDRDMEVVVMNNTSGRLIYKDSRTLNIYELDGYGDTEYMTVGELVNMKNREKALLMKYWLLIIDIDEDNVEVEELLRYLKIEGLYEHVIKDAMDVDKLILKSRESTFKSTMEKMNEYYCASVINRAVTLFREGEFNHYGKMKIMATIAKKPHLFEDVENQLD